MKLDFCLNILIITFMILPCLQVKAKTKDTYCLRKFSQIALQEEIVKLRRIVKMTDQQAERIAHAKNILSYVEFSNKRLNLRAGEKAYLLGPRGDDYVALLKVGLGDFRDAFREVGMTSYEEQSKEYVTEFLHKLLRKSNVKVYYFMPSDVTVDTKSVREFQIFSSDPNLMFQVILIYGSK